MCLDFCCSVLRYFQKSLFCFSHICKVATPRLGPAASMYSVNKTSFTKLLLLKESRLTGGGSHILVDLIELMVRERGNLGLQIVSSHFTHDCTLVLYKQLIQTWSLMGFSYFPLCWAFLSTRTQAMGEPPHTSSISGVYSLVWRQCRTLVSGQWLSCTTGCQTMQRTLNTENM